MLAVQRDYWTFTFADKLKEDSACPPSDSTNRRRMHGYLTGGGGPTWKAANDVSGQLQPRHLCRHTCWSSDASHGIVASSPVDHQHPAARGLSGCAFVCHGVPSKHQQLACARSSIRSPKVDAHQLQQSVRGALELLPCVFPIHCLQHPAAPVILEM